MELIELLLIPIYIALISMAALVVQEIKYKGQAFKWYFITGLLFKIMGGLFFASMYVFYYTQGGDTNVYHWCSSVINEALFYDPEAAIRLLLANPGEFDYKTIDLVGKESYFYSMYRTDATYMVVRFATILGILGLNSFWLITILFATLSFSGLWAMYRVFVDKYPEIYQSLAIPVFFLPSVFMWGSGIMKDTITVGCLGWLFYGCYHLFIKKDKVLLSLVIIPITFFLIATIKAYVIVAFVPAMFYWVLAHYWVRIKDGKLVAAILINVLSFAVLAWYFYGPVLYQISDMLLVKFVEKAVDFHSWHGYLAQTRDQSGYDLGEIDFTFGGILAKFPAAIEVTFFRPYLYEVRKPIILLTAVESMGFLLFTVYALFKVGVLRFFSLIFKRPIIGFCFIYAMLFGFAVGFSSYNFGALARYKIPCLPFYIATIMMVLYEAKKNTRQGNT